jgi:hypothetical protein
MTTFVATAAQAQDSAVNISLELRARDRAVGQEFRSIALIGGSRDASDQAVKLALGNDIAICFQASQDGYVTVWSIDSKGAQDLIYPNKYSHPGKERGGAVKANKRTCVGEKDDPFKLVVSSPTGKSHVYLYWTRTLDEQIAPEDYPSVGRGTFTRATGYAERSVDYDAVTRN